MFAMHTTMANYWTRALYLRGDPYETSDAVFGVQESLITDLKTVDDEQVKQYGVKAETRLIPGIRRRFEGVERKECSGGNESTWSEDEIVGRLACA